MSISSKVFITYLVCGTGLAALRLMPFLLLKKFNLPKAVVEFLEFVPIVIMTTLWFSSLFTAKQGHLPQIDWQYAIVTIPALITAYFTRSLMWIVVVGVASLALIRLL